MNVVWAALITAAVTAVAVAAMLLVRRRAPEGGYFADGDRAAGVFGVLATGFSVLLGFIVFLAFTSYDQSRRARRGSPDPRPADRDRSVLPGTCCGQFTGELVCYGRSVANGEWDRMRAGTPGDSHQPLERQAVPFAEAVRPTTAVEQSAYDKWLDQTSLGNRRAAIESTARSG